MAKNDPTWVNAILARRLHFYDRTLSICSLLEKQAGSGVTREGLVRTLKAAQAEADHQLPEDDLRVMDDLAFYGAISTIQNNRRAPAQLVLDRYLVYLNRRATQPERSTPRLDTIRTLTVTIPNPLSNESLPEDFRSARAAVMKRLTAGVSTATTSTSYCQILSSQFSASATPAVTCSEGVPNNDYTFDADSFTQYNANTNKTTNKTWSSPANLGPFQAIGVCWAYTDCDQDEQIYYIPGTATGEGAANPIVLTLFKVSQGQSPQRFWWTLDNYPQPSLSDCDDCDPYPAGQENPVSTNAPVSSTVFSFDYTCTVTP